MTYERQLLMFRFRLGEVCGAVAQLVRESSNRVCTFETLQNWRFKSQ